MNRSLISELPPSPPHQHGRGHGPLDGEPGDQRGRQQQAGDNERSVGGRERPCAEAIHRVDGRLQVGHRVVRGEQCHEGKGHLPNRLEVDVVSFWTITTHVVALSPTFTYVVFSCKLVHLYKDGMADSCS